MINCEKCGMKITKKNFIKHKHKNYAFVEEKKKEVCSICGEKYDGYGNNAVPMAKGRCCDSCNEFFVVPARLMEKIRKIKENERKKKKLN